MIVTNMRSGSLTKSHTHHDQATPPSSHPPQPDPLDCPCPSNLTCYQLLLCSVYKLTIGDDDYGWGAHHANLNGTILTF